MQQDNGCARSALEVGDAPSLDADFGHISLLALTAAHEPRRFLGVGSMRLFGPNRTAALLGVNLGL